VPNDDDDMWALVDMSSAQPSTVEPRPEAAPCGSSEHPVALVQRAEARKPLNSLSWRWHEAGESGRAFQLPQALLEIVQQALDVRQRAPARGDAETQSILFWHTGGTAALSAFADEL